MKRYAVCITDDDGGTGEAVFTVKNKTDKNCWWPLSNPCNARNAITDAGIIRIIPAG